MSARAALALALAFTSWTALVEAAAYYRWTDAQGVTHYTDKPPAAAEATAVEKLKSAAPTRLKKDVAQRGEASAPTSGAAEQARAQRCQEQQSRLSTLQNNRVIQTPDTDGSMRTLSSAEIDDEIKFTKKSIELYCTYQQ